MLRIKDYSRILLYTFLLLSIFNESEAKKLDKYYNSDKISQYFSGVLSLNKNEYLTSYDYLKKLEGLEDAHPFYSKVYQYSLVNLGKISEAYNYSKKIKKKQINNFESDLIIGVYFLKNKKFKEANHHFKRLKGRHGDQTFKILLSDTLNSWVSFPKINQEDALSSNKNISKRFKNVQKIQDTFTHCFFNSTQTNEKFSELTSDKEVNSSRYNFFHANYLYSVGKEKEAKIIIEESLKLYPRNLILNQFKIDLQDKKKVILNNNFDCKNISHNIAEFFYILANAMSKQYKFALSNFYLNLGKYLNPNFISFDVLQAENFYMTDQLDKSKTIYERIGKKGSEYYWFASKQIVSILKEENKEEDPLKYLYERYKKISEPNIYQKFDYANFLKNNDEFEKSIKYYTEVLNLIDENNYLYPKVTDGRGVAYERINEWEKAEKDLLNSLKASPEQAYVLNYLAYSWIEQGINIEKSLQMLKKANQIKKNDGYIIDSIGWALFKLHRHEEAKEYLELAVLLMPSDPVINDHFGDSLWMNNYKIQARYYWNYVLNLKETDQKLRNSVKNKLLFGKNSDL